MILRKTQLYEAAVAAEKKSRALRDLLRVSIKNQSSLPDIIDDIVHVAYEVLEADRVTLFFVDEHKGEVFSIVSKDAQGLSFKVVGFFLFASLC